MDNVEYEACPYCSSKQVIKDVNTKTQRVIIRCGECECQIDSYPIKKPNE